MKVFVTFQYSNTPNTLTLMIIQFQKLWMQTLSKKSPINVKYRYFPENCEAKVSSYIQVSGVYHYLILI